MKNCRTLSLILLLLLLITSRLICSQINFFVNYNFITFSSFDKLIHDTPYNIKLYLEYNPLIPVYLNWNKNYLISKLKINLINQKISLFKLNNNLSISSTQKRWFVNMQKNTDAEIFKNFYSDTNIKQLDSKHDFINILNFKELNLILETINNKNLKSYLNFKLDLSFLLQEKFDKFLEVLNKHTGFKYNFYIFSDTRYSASKKEINHFIDLIYTLKTQKKLSKPEKKIFDLSYSLFNIKLFDSINDLLLNLFPLTTTSKIYKKYNVSSMEYMINKSKYITLFDNQNFFTFDTETGYLKKWFLHNKGICLINFDSFIETLYIKNKKGTTPVQIQNLNYFKFNNGIMFKYDSKKSVSMEKNIILQHSKLLLTYKIKNNFKKKKSFILMLENKFSPSLLNNLIALNNN